MEITLDLSPEWIFLISGILIFFRGGPRCVWRIFYAARPGPGPGPPQSISTFHTTCRRRQTYFTLRNPNTLFYALGVLAKMPWEIDVVLCRYVFYELDVFIYVVPIKNSNTHGISSLYAERRSNCQESVQNWIKLNDKSLNMKKYGV